MPIVGEDETSHSNSDTDNVKVTICSIKKCFSVFMCVTLNLLKKVRGHPKRRKTVQKELSYLFVTCAWNVTLGIRWKETWQGNDNHHSANCRHYRLVVIFSCCFVGFFCFDVLFYSNLFTEIFLSVVLFRILLLLLLSFCAFFVENLGVYRVRELFYFW